MQSEVLNQVHNDIHQNLLLIVKLGFDGSSGQSEYKQNFTNEAPTTFWI